MRLLALTDRPDAGELAWRGHALVGTGAVPGRARGHRAYRASLGMVFQNPGLDTLLTMRENLALQGALAGLDRAATARRIDELARQLDLDTRLDDRVGTLSGGTVRRADLARALVPTPTLLLLDEATTGLDLRARGEFFDLLTRLRRTPHEPTPPQERAGTPAHPLTIVMTTHLMDEAERADRVIMMSRGRIVADDSPTTLRARVGTRVLRYTLPAALAPATRLELNAHIRTLLSLPAAIPAEPPAIAPAFNTAPETAAAASLSGPAADQSGLHATNSKEATIRLAGDRPPGLASALDVLTRADAEVHVGPPTLADAYLALTGSSLGAALPAENTL